MPASPTKAATGLCFAATARRWICCFALLSAPVFVRAKRSRYRSILPHRSSAKEAEILVDEIDAKGGKAKAYKADVDDAAYATFQLAGGVIAHINSSWCTRVRRDDLVTFHVDGTLGSAVAGLQKCFSQALS